MSLLYKRFSKFETITGGFLILTVLFGGMPSASRAHEDEAQEMSFFEELDAAYAESTAAGGDTTVALDDDDDVGAIVDGLKEQITKRKTQAEQLRSQMSAYQKAIEEKRREAVTLENELLLIENKIAKTELDIAANQLEIEATELEIRELQAQIQEKSMKMMRQRELIGEFLRSLHRADQKSAIDLLLTQRTLSEFFNDVQFIEEAQRELKSTIDTVKQLKADLERREGEENDKKMHLGEIRLTLENAKADLTEQEGAKEVLSEQVRISETRYRYELAQLQKEVRNIDADIAASERRLRQTLDADRLRKLSGGTSGWTWPVPSMYITTQFHDPDYPFRHVYEHPGIDIRAGQGTSVRAAMGGYVARAKDAGMGYSYVMLVHDGGVSTVYGHLSRILVQEDTYIEKGEVIALSGGAPGTPGAGAMTTAPHLHFETRLNGIPVNPLNYLKQ